MQYYITVLCSAGAPGRAVRGAALVIGRDSAVRGALLGKLNTLNI